MRKSVLVIAILVIAMQTTVYSQTDNLSSAKNFIDHFFKGEYAKAHEYFADGLKAKVPLEALPQIAQQITGQFGAFKSQGNQRTEKFDEGEEVSTRCEFEKMPLAMVIVFGNTGKIGTFNLVPYPAEKSSDYPGEELKLKTKGAQLSGTLLLPASDGQVPLVIFHAGSGPTDRDGNQINSRADSYRLLAEGLAKKGIASFRYDKRGVGKSRLNARPEDMLFEDFVDDLTAWCEMFRKDTRFSSLTLAGHSEGSLTGMLAAQKIGTDGFISIAGAGQRISKVLRIQLRKQVSPALMKKAEAALVSLEQGKTTACPPGLEDIFRDGVQPFMISWIKYDPAKEIAKLKIPVLVIQGNADTQVSVYEARLLSKKPVIIRGMNHSLKQVSKDAGLIAKSKGDPPPVEPKLVNEMVKFVNGLKKK